MVLKLYFGGFVVTSVGEIAEVLKNAPCEEIPLIVERYKDDQRKSVKKLIETALRRYGKYINEMKRLEAISQIEECCYKDGARYIAGVDEVGRGPLAGPVVTAAVILKPGWRAEGVNDSKKLSEKKREELYEVIIRESEAYCITMEDNCVIDDINILNATLKAMKRAVEGLSIKPDVVLVDAVRIPDIDIKQQSIIKGDEKSISIAAASIIAKVTRDRLMTDMAKLYPGYDFENNKGYGTKKHIAALKERGLCPIHRLSFTKGIL